MTPNPTNLEFSSHPIFSSLPRDLRPVVAGWIDQLISGNRAINGEELLRMLNGVIFAGHESNLALSDDEWNRVELWLGTLPEERVLEVFERRVHGGPKAPFRAATVEQLSIIVESQEDAEVDFTELFPKLTSWMADIVIKGLIVVSEMRRQTGDRRLPIRDLRQAIRSYLAGKRG